MFLIKTFLIITLGIHGGKSITNYQFILQEVAFFNILSFGYNKVRASVYQEMLHKLL